MIRAGRLAAAALVPLAACITPRGAVAHVAIAGADDFTAGLLHPVFVLGHILTIVALGLLLGQQGSAHLKAALPSFTAALAAGLIGAGVSLAPSGSVESVLLAIAVGLGCLVALARPIPRRIVAAVAAAAGFAIGIDSAPDLQSPWRSFLALAATGISVSLLLINVIVAAGYLNRPWQRIGVRVAGSWIGAAALMVSALTLR